MSATGDTGGFTLIEMLVVLAIAALISGLIFPRVETMLAEQGRLTTLAAVGGTLRATRAAAIRTGAVTRFAIAPGGTRFAGADTLVQTTSPTVTLAGPATGIVFFADGSASGGAILVSGRGSQTRIAIDADSGAIGQVK